MAKRFLFHNPPPPATGFRKHSCVLIDHHADTDSKRDLRDDIPFNMTPQEMLELAADIERRLLHVYAQSTRPQHQNAFAIMQNLVQGLRHVAQTQRWRPEAIEELKNCLVLVGALWHFSNVQSWVLRPDEAESLFQLHQVLCEFEAVAIANIVLRNLVDRPAGIRKSMRLPGKPSALTTAVSAPGLPQGNDPKPTLDLAYTLVRAIHVQKKLKRGRWFSQDEELRLLKYASYLRGAVLEKFPDMTLSYVDIDLRDPGHAAIGIP